MQDLYLLNVVLDFSFGSDNSCTYVQTLVTHFVGFVRACGSVSEEAHVERLLDPFTKIKPSFKSPCALLFQADHSSGLSGGYDDPQTLGRGDLEGSGVFPSRDTLGGRGAWDGDYANERTGVSS